MSTKKGRPTKDPSGQRQAKICISIRPETKAALAEASRKTGIPQSRIIENALWMYTKKQTP